ncbi:MAG TPA: acyl-CoA dehydrogenase family protein [Thermoleophilaceae bacterium]|nr:acyl-CoA dehydrogenase family protein [Thermoleophilaceae bacterium]
MATIEKNPAREVLNQPPPLEGYNVYESNRPLVEALRREGAEAFEDRVRALGARAGTAESLERGRLANEYPPVLRTHDRFGNRIDEVEFHPAWHELLELSVASGIHALPWREPVPGAQAGRAAMMLAMSGVESGTGCPLSMTYAGVPALRAQPEVAQEWEPRFLSLEYDSRSAPASEKRGALMGMAMTERQGGSDVRANTTVARPLNGGGSGAEYELSGHKWFCSAPMCDAFMVLAQADGGLSCFLLPRWTPDGERNRFHIQRLKDKLGNRSNASSEVEFDNAWARMVGPEGRGVPTIIEMVNYTRLDCVLGSTGLVRAAVAQAIHHCAHRAAFGKTLIDQPLMRNVLADLAIESEAATLTAMRLARACDEGDPFKRLGLAVSKYWVCKSAVWHVAEALECLGGNGYVELSGMPRLYREAPLNSIWEGSGNVNCLDVLRGMVRSPESVDAFFGEVESVGGEVADYSRGVRDELSDLEDIELRARRIVERMAIALQASVLVRHGDPAVADAFVATRLRGDHGRALGTLPPGTDFERIVERHRPLV